ncbi:AIPR family protein [Parafrankia sp. BMG5.11]|uniref:AIPR family protein n=1 Tax=Parafrankia sp. BMG5.11 TaxID=222540 RepID=UPI00103C5651|nr:AIPR family protein [Parafrankia sp. BMG5.11]TCJ34573.1 AIPR protein [Parafrankia sp. BMG5.11]
MARQPRTNAQTLLMRIFESWRIEKFPDAPESFAFEVFVSELVMRSYGLQLDEVEAGVVGGGQDGAIDSVYTIFDDVLLDEDSEVLSPSRKPSEFGQNRSLDLWIIQAKRTPGFAEEAIDKLENSLRRLLDLSQDLDELSALYNSTVLNRVRIFRTAWEKLLVRRPRIRVHVIYATPGDVRNITPQVESKIALLRSVIQGSVPDAGNVEVATMGDKELLARYNDRPSYTLPMRYQESATSGQSHVALVRLKDYYDLIVDENGRLRRHLFEWNVRDYQGNVAVNQDIRRSLTTPDGPEFWWLNNGVTILCGEATSAGKTYSLSDIQIVNGLQTSHEIYDALRDSPTLDDETRMILVRIIVTDDAETRDQVIRATNRQTNIDDASLRATDEVQRNIENFFLTQGWYYDRRKNYYKNEGKDSSKIVGIPLLGAAITAMGLARPDKARGKPSSLLKKNEDYRPVFDRSIPLEVYFWAAKTQRMIDTFIVSETAAATVMEKSNLKYHLAMLVVEALNGGPVRSPHGLRFIAGQDLIIDSGDLATLFEQLKRWASSYLAAENVETLERAAKTHRFTEYLLRCAAEKRAN